ncbi:L-aspartate oxidase [Thermoleophilum album]|uniref:L-aspartate oxidase n=1 Tax=Thermoleophilum album TaxID=29539 RepID=A0A1H6FU63_THEAL|nr:FAD-binding protein [Thermoleophilum album]SEH13718.1 L-aspartate oxidase [Thermoleophilum album]
MDDARREVVERHELAAALTCDVLVVGAGLAGLFAAIVAARSRARVILASSTALDASASWRAQGGIAAALAPDDAPQLHAEDTLRAGRGACRPEAVEVVAREAPLRVLELMELGVVFDRSRDGALQLGLEGGHSRRRIVHAGGSATGRRVTRRLSALAAADPRITVLEQTRVVRLLPAADAAPACSGALARTADGQLLELRARATVLATGGHAALWERTTNPTGAVGSGVWLALAAGAKVADLEFLQFHPTALALPGPLDGFLISEAVRGEGARLLDERGERFCNELAPRDEVALAIWRRLSAGHRVYLDARELPLRSRFPNIARALREAGIDAQRELIPIAPAAHYAIGGVATDLDARTSLPGLYAVGECSCSGLHGANRLASNSLAECLVFAHRAVRRALDEPPLEPPAHLPPPLPSPTPTPPTRARLWRYAGIERHAEGLRQLLVDPHPLARLVAAFALARTESRGVHRRREHPEPQPVFERKHFLYRRPPTADDALALEQVARPMDTKYLELESW